MTNTATNTFKILALIVTLSFLSACSTPKKSRVALTLGGFAAGAAVGSTTAPTGERQDMHSMYWGGILGLASALAANYYFSEETELRSTQLEIGKLKAEMDLLQNANKVLLKEGKGYFKNASGEEYFQLGKAKWRIYQIDKWQKDGPNRLYHMDRMVELMPAPENSNDAEK